MRILISECEIRQRVTELGAAISEEYAGKPLTVLGVLTGSVILLADLIRATSVPLRVALIQASSYPGARMEAGPLSVDRSLVPDLNQRDVLILDDIFDTGRTMLGLISVVQEYRPRSLRSAVLLWKTARTCVDLRPDYFGFSIPDEFVVGYGLDFNDEFRHLPYIAVPDEADLAEARRSAASCSPGNNG